MPLFSKPQLEKTAYSETQFIRKSASTILREAKKSVDPTAQFDIFLSHRYLDARYVLGLKIEIEELGYSVFVDWVERPDLDRAQVTRATAAWLRDVMNRCRCLFYALSHSSPGSKWMPWELGYSDGKHGKVAIVPILDYTIDTEAYTYGGLEYLSLYPYVTMTPVRGEEYRQDLWINESEQVYVSLPQWLKGKAPRKRST
jgi:hypothetical protein